MPDPAQPVVDRTTLRLPAACFRGDKCPKDLIVLHFTAGLTARGAFDAWRSWANGVSAPYLVAPDGRIFETYDPSLWSFHLGASGETNRNWRQDRRSIAIEIVNPGPLRRLDDTLYWWPANFSTEFCKTNRREAYVAAPFRGFDYFAAFTCAQYQALGALVPWLCRRFRIPARIADSTKRTQFDLAFFAGFQGIAAHQNFRPDKTDIGPAFEWNRLDLAAL